MRCMHDAISMYELWTQRVFLPEIFHHQLMLFKTGFCQKPGRDKSFLFYYFMCRHVFSDHLLRLSRLWPMFIRFRQTVICIINIKVLFKDMTWWYTRLIQSRLSVQLFLTRTLSRSLWVPNLGAEYILLFTEDYVDLERERERGIILVSISSILSHMTSFCEQLPNDNVDR